MKGRGEGEGDFSILALSATAEHPAFSSPNQPGVGVQKNDGVRGMPQATRGLYDRGPGAGLQIPVDPTGAADLANQNAPNDYARAFRWKPGDGKPIWVLQPRFDDRVRRIAALLRDPGDGGEGATGPARETFRLRWPLAPTRRSGALVTLGGIDEQGGPFRQRLARNRWPAFRRSLSIRSGAR